MDGQKGFSNGERTCVGKRRKITCIVEKKGKTSGKNNTKSGGLASVEFASGAFPSKEEVSEGFKNRSMM